ncbi:hypothetical protein ACFXDJ_03065 [Streptomyces sp. NPDC059443]|uniref:hypothetical protein n=1 Tax=unclassified Streptomyces TaxID=2593676 RepID=UPI0036B602C4
MKAALKGTGTTFHYDLTREEAEALRADATFLGPNLHTNDGTWYAITEGEPAA